jgi:uncharacterized membrane protein YqjE
MAANTSTANETAGTGTLVKEIAKDVETLAHQHIRLLKADIKEDFRIIRDGAAALAVGVAVSLVGGVILAMAMAQLLALAFPEAWDWAAYAIVGILTAGAGGVLLCMARRSLKEAAPPAEHTLEALEDDVQWMKNPK